MVDSDKGIAALQIAVRHLSDSMMNHLGGDSGRFADRLAAALVARLVSDEQHNQPAAVSVRAMLDLIKAETGSGLSTLQALDLVELAVRAVTLGPPGRAGG